MPVLLFCIAFGLSMDYEVFLISRIREFWLQSGQTAADNDESVALGVARTGRVITAAALVMSISFAALIAAKGVVHADVRHRTRAGRPRRRDIGPNGDGARLHARPGPMELVGTKPLTRLHQRFGISESGNQPDPDSTAVPAADPR